MKKQFRLLLGVFLLSSTSLMYGQKATNIKINEVLTRNTSGVEDEFGQREAWVEIANASFSTFNVRGMYITTDRSVLDPNMTVSERINKMSMIPNEEVRTNLTARQHLLFYCNSNPAKGSLHLSVKINPAKPVWIALYDGNATDIVDSVTVPPLGTNESYARIHDGAAKWEKKDSTSVTPGISNYIRASESKVAKVKRQDPYGIGITVLAMGIVFFCLFLMYAFFRIFGIFMERKSAKKAGDRKPMNGDDSKSATPDKKSEPQNLDKDICIAVISMALKQYQDDVHDVESDIITIKPKHTGWNDEAMELIHFID